MGAKTTQKNHEDLAEKYKFSSQKVKDLRGLGLLVDGFDSSESSTICPLSYLMNWTITWLNSFWCKCLLAQPPYIIKVFAHRRKWSWPPKNILDSWWSIILAILDVSDLTVMTRLKKKVNKNLKSLKAEKGTTQRFPEVLIISRAFWFKRTQTHHEAGALLQDYTMMFLFSEESADRGDATFPHNSPQLGISSRGPSPIRIPVLARVGSQEEAEEPAAAYRRITRYSRTRRPVLPPRRRTSPPGSIQWEVLAKFVYVHRSGNLQDRSSFGWAEWVIIIMRASSGQSGVVIIRLNWITYTIMKGVPCNLEKYKKDISVPVRVEIESWKHIVIFHFQPWFQCSIWYLEVFEARNYSDLNVCFSTFHVECFCWNIGVWSIQSSKSNTPKLLKLLLMIWVVYIETRNICELLSSLSPWSPSWRIFQLCFSHLTLTSTKTERDHLKALHKKVATESGLHFILVLLCECVVEWGLYSDGPIRMWWDRPERDLPGANPSSQMRCNRTGSSNTGAEDSTLSHTLADVEKIGIFLPTRKNVLKVRVRKENDEAKDKLSMAEEVALETEEENGKMKRHIGDFYWSCLLSLASPPSIRSCHVFRAILPPLKISLVQLLTKRPFCRSILMLSARVSA